MPFAQSDKFSHDPLLTDPSELATRLQDDRYMRSMAEKGHDHRWIEALADQQAARVLRAIRIERKLAFWLDIRDGIRRWASGKYHNVMVPKATITVLKVHAWAKRQLDSSTTIK